MPVNVSSGFWDQSKTTSQLLAPQAPNSVSLFCFEPERFIKPSAVTRVKVDSDDYFAFPALSCRKHRVASSCRKLRGIARLYAVPLLRQRRHQQWRQRREFWRNIRRRNALRRFWKRRGSKQRGGCGR